MLLINALILILTFLLLTTPAHAYLDPGSGSFIIQMAIGALLGGLITLKLYFQKIKILILGLFNKKKKNDPDSSRK